MGNLFRAFRAGMQGAKHFAGPARYTAAGLPVACTHCKGNVFESREAQINTWKMAFADLDWMNRSGVALICVRCGLIQWFAASPERIYEDGPLPRG